jgi:tricorn protease
VTASSADTAYLRFPSIRGDRVAFVAENDVWLGSVDGGRAFRLTADGVPVAGTQLSPDGATVAFTSTRDGAPEVHVVPVEGGPSRRLSFWGDAFTKVAGWLPDGRVVASTAVGEPFRSRTWAWALPLDGGAPERLPYGPTTVVSVQAAGGTLLGVDQRRAGAAWKRYRGGTAPKLWIDPDGSGAFHRFLAELDGQLEDPGWIADRVVFLSDHEGWANVYSARPDGTDLRRHSDHGESYARALRADGTRAVYQRLGEIWLVDDLDAAARPRRLEISLAGPRTGRQPYPVQARDWLGEMAVDRTGRATALEVLGTVHWLTSRDGPVPALLDQPGVRARLPRVLGPPAGAGSSGTAVPEVAWVTDADGDDAVEVAPADGSAPPRRMAAGRLGRVLELVAAPDGSSLGVATHDGRVLVVDVASGEVREIARTGHDDASGLAFSPDSAWLAWSHPGAEGLSQIRAARVADRTGDPAAVTVEVTPLRFRDTSPVFTLDGLHLAFLSTRTFDPVYDELVFDLSFPGATRPYLVPLAATTPSPFHPEPGGRPAGGPGGPGGAGGSDGGGGGREDDAPPQPVILDPEAIEQRVIAVPVAAARCRSLRAVQGGLVWLEEPQHGLLGEDRPAADGEPVRPRLLRYDFGKRRSLTLADAVDGFGVSGDGKRLLLRDDKALRMVPADRRVDPDEEGDRDAVVEVDLRRVRVQVDPAAQWRQMFDEAGRLMRDHFWIADMADVDWAGVLERYRPVLDRVATRDDLSELFWEVAGELGSSHAYETPPPRPVPPGRALGHLGADLERDGDRWVVRRVLPGESSVRGARSPLSSPGVAVRAGDAIVAVDGRPVDPRLGPTPLLAGAAGVPVELTVQPAGSAEVRRVVVVPLEDERPLRYQAWVADRRAAVHEASGGRVGYLHIPDMVANGWAQLHRDLVLEVARDGLVVDVRDNNGGHVSELVLEKLSRRVQGWDTTRHAPPITYPTNAPRGPMVLVANEHAGSDGDIVTAGFKQLKLGPVLGMRTWGGVIGIDDRYTLVDGTLVTQPRYSFWFKDYGWDIENYGVDPDVEIPIPPQDWATGRDPQLDAAVRMVLDTLDREPAARPPDPASRPSRRPPDLPPRS